MNYLELGSAPLGEDCVQLSSKVEYLEEMIKECRRYKELLEKLFPHGEEVRASFKIKSFQHDFGTYKEVCVVYDDNDEASCEYAYNVEENLPERWESE